MELDATRPDGPRPQQQPIVTGRDTIKVGEQEYRIKSVKVNGKVIDFKDLRHSEQAFKKEISDKAEKSLRQFQGQLDNKTGTYTLQLSKEKTTIKGKDIQGEDFEHEIVKSQDAIAKREARLNELQAAAQVVFKKRDLQAEQIQKHSFKKEMPSFLKEVAVTASVIALTIFTGPIFLIIGGLIHVGLGLSDLLATKIDGTQTLQEAANKMKAAEEKAKLEGMQKSVASFGLEEILNSVNSKDLYKDNSILQNKVERHVERALARDDKKITKEQKNQLKLLKNEDFKDVNTLTARLKELIPELDETLTTGDIGTLIQESAAIRQDTQEQDIKKLTDLRFLLLQGSTKDPAITNQLITAQLREVINSPMYQALKEDPNNEYVRFVHCIACGIWNSNVETLHAYQEFGRTVLSDPKVVDPTVLQQKNPVDGLTMRTILESSHRKTSQELFTDHSIPQKILYAFAHPLQTLGSLASMGGTSLLIADTFGHGIYDSHGELRNNPSLQGSTTAVINTKQGAIETKINNCYGGSPTVGDRISPEFHAMCQAAENNQFARVKDPNIPSVVYYTNFQEIENRHGEGERSFAIMELNRRYPLSFVGMTLSKDSDFYLMKGAYKDALWPGAEEFGKEFLTILQNDKCYQYGDRAGNHDGNGFYLPGGKKAWDPILNDIIQRANIRFKEIEKQRDSDGNLPSPEKLRGAYQEYVYSMIQAHTEMEIAATAANSGSPVLITAIRACKENIDRGGAENAKYLHSRLPLDTSAEELISLTNGSLESRAISARDRTILEHRLPQVLGFIELVDRKDFQEDMQSMFETGGLKFAKDPHFATPVKPSSTKKAEVDEDEEISFSDSDDEPTDNFIKLT